MNNFTAYTKLMDEGIIHEDGTTIKRLISLLFRLQGQGENAFNLIQLLAGVTGVPLLDCFPHLRLYPPARDYFLFSLLLDFEEVAAEQWAEDLSRPA